MGVEWRNHMKYSTVRAFASRPETMLGVMVEKICRAKGTIVSCFHGELGTSGFYVYGVCFFGIDRSLDMYHPAPASHITSLFFWMLAQPPGLRRWPQNGIQNGTQYGTQNGACF